MGVNNNFKLEGKHLHSVYYILYYIFPPIGSNLRWYQPVIKDDKYEHKIKAGVSHKAGFPSLFVYLDILLLLGTIRDEYLLVLRDREDTTGGLEVR